LESREKGQEARLREILATYNEAWMKYWDSYIKLQDQLYESLRAGREVSWLAATDERKMSEINQVPEHASSAGLRPAGANHA